MVKVPCNRLKNAEGDRGKAVHSIDLSARRCGWSAPRPGRFSPGKDPVPIVQKAGLVPRPVWTCARNLTPTGVRSLDRPACSQSLYWLSYPGPCPFRIPMAKSLICVTREIWKQWNVPTCSNPLTWQVALLCCLLTWRKKGNIATVQLSALSEATLWTAFFCRPTV
jgi:hypothetical protein